MSHILLIDQSGSMGEIPNGVDRVMPYDTDKSGTMWPADMEAFARQMSDMFPNGEDDLLVVFTDGET